MKRDNERRLDHLEGRVHILRPKMRPPSPFPRVMELRLEYPGYDSDFLVVQQALTVAWIKEDQEEVVRLKSLCCVVGSKELGSLQEAERRLDAWITTLEYFQEEVQGEMERRAEARARGDGEEEDDVE